MEHIGVDVARWDSAAEGQACRSNDVAGRVETTARQRIRRGGLSPGLPQALIHGVKERLVFFDRAAERGPEIVAMKRRDSLTGIIQALVLTKSVEIEVVQRIEIIPRVQHIVTQIIEQITVELV